MNQRADSRNAGTSMSVRSMIQVALFGAIIVILASPLSSDTSRLDLRERPSSTSR